ncbi:MAG TPA: hypothetical protein PJ982_04105 [Lacipirellulaceae bacterium]|nr:hypothetical protein [Lacipirellulaceae bacterium]
MQVAGRLLVLVTLAIALGLSAGAWWYHYGQSRRAAQFWGPESARLLLSSESTLLLTLDDADETDGQAVADEFDLTGRNGLVHLRHALTFDGNFDWERRRMEPVAAGDTWRYVLRFADGDEHLDILFTRDFQRLGRLDAAGDQADVLDCPRLGPVLVRDLVDVGAPLATQDTAPR